MDGYTQIDDLADYPSLYACDLCGVLIRERWPNYTGYGQTDNLQKHLQRCPDSEQK